MKISRLGEAPDYRFSLANERTYLAWIRTALGFLAAGVGLDQLAPDFATPLIREVLALLLCLFAGVLAIYGYLRWLRNEKAMRLKQESALYAWAADHQRGVAGSGRCGDGAGVLWRIAAKRVAKPTPAFSPSVRRWPGCARCWGMVR
ncbi:inner membrane protein YidH [Enterobacter cancerogenus]|uniref:Inner membrane protein YidH n=1 Tax=Enterobacter cancerogenus TaxID=69218 RepID=A0A484WX03_9ENTR|nr:inner membrane protein YidH [Enterobacter cancerogenus]